MGGGSSNEPGISLFFVFMFSSLFFSPSPLFPSFPCGDGELVLSPPYFPNLFTIFITVQNTHTFHYPSVHHRKNSGVDKREFQRINDKRVFPFSPRSDLNG